MKLFNLKIISSKLQEGSNTKWIHVTDEGKRFLGRPSFDNVGLNDTVSVECSELMGDGYYHIIKVLGITRGK